ncbi:hypothetical protein LTS10_007295 [Elasticomyces elasticus]|nr:hypothetical protein LTS10_007295 [Elasticomyces elasticus]
MIPAPMKKNPDKSIMEAELKKLQSQAKSIQPPRDTSKWRPPPAKRPDILMTLPPELRNIIYEHALARDRLFCITFQLHTENHWREPALLQVSKTIRTEALPFHYTGNNFSIHVWLSALPTLCEKIERLSRRCGLKPFKSVRLEIMHPIRGDMHCGRHLAMLFYRKIELVGLAGQKAGDESQPLLSCAHSVCLEALRTAVAIGKKGAIENWSEEEIRDKLDKWLANEDKGSSPRAWKMAFG